MTKRPKGEIECRSLFGKIQRFPADQFRFRPAVYGVAVQAGRVLLGRSAFSGLLDIPGGAVEPYETLVEGLKREFAEETGVVPEPGPLLHFNESFFAIFDHPYHSLRFYYRVSVPADAELRPQPNEIRDLAWVDIGDYAAEEFAPGDLTVLRLALAGLPS